MPFKKKLFSMFSIPEKSLFKKASEYTDHIMTATEILSKMLDCPTEEISIYKESIWKHEVEGDRITFDLKNEITGGSITPNLMDSFTQLIDKFDDILDRIYYMSREILRYQDFLASCDDNAKKKTCQYYSFFKNILVYNSEAQKTIVEMLEQNSIDRMVSLWSKVSHLEEEVDDLKDEILDSLYKEANNLHYLTFMHLVEITHKLDDLLDIAQDISDILINIAITVKS